MVLFAYGRFVRSLLVASLPMLLLIGLPSQYVAADDDSSTNFGRAVRDITPLPDRNPETPLTEREKVFHVLSRFTFGATPAMIDHVQEVGLEEWFDAQLKGEAEEPAELTAALGKLDTLTMTIQDIVKKYNPPMPKELSLANRLTPEQRRQRAEIRALNDVPKNQLKDAVIYASILSRNQLKETTADFWRNHFSIDVSKGAVRYYATTWERDVIRGETLGTFEAMLNKQARHPAMLVFLDNFISRAPTQQEVSTAAQEAFSRTRDYATVMDALDIVKMKGLNENYARELMELHTLGVDNYYTQEDVIAVAEALTGWSVQQSVNQPIAFEFKPEMHATANRRLLKMPIRASPQNGELEGQAVLDKLVKHKGTSEFIAHKLCRHFVNDRPSPKMVDRVAKEFRRRTDLPATYKAIFEDEEFFAPHNYQAKFKRPAEFVASALRVTEAEIVDTRGIHDALLSLNEPLYQCEDPTGYYDQADVWRDPGVMAGRWQFGLGLGMGWVRGVKIPDSYWDGMEPNNPLQWKTHLAQKILPMGHSTQTDEALERVIAKYARFNPDPEQLGRYIVGILLGSPEFQRQ